MQSNIRTNCVRPDFLRSNTTHTSMTMNQSLTRICKMKLTVLLLVLSISVGAQAQFGGGFRGFFHGASNFFQPMQHMFHHHVARPVSHFMPHFRMPFFGGHHGHHGQAEDFRSNGVGNTREKATKEPQATGIDKLYPDDCGRDDKNKGLLCFPDGQVCAESTVLKSQIYSI